MDKGQGKRTRFKKGQGGRKLGSKNKKTIVLERIYQRCMERGFHPADFIIDCLKERGLSVSQKIDTAFRLAKYMEAEQTVAKPVTPNTPEDSVQAAKETMQELEALSQPLEPKAQP